MSSFEEMLASTSPYDAYRWAEGLFRDRDYYGAARVLALMLEEHPEGATSARELLARAYFHSAQIGKATEAARDLLEREPDNAYAALLLTRSLERSSRPEEAAAARKVSEALGN